MSLSFEDSLNAAKAAEEAEIDAFISAATAPAEDYSVAVLSDTSEDIVAYANENWTRHPDYKHYSVFSDVNVSKVGTDKSIVLDPSQFNITQESNSQYIPFEMPRSYDGFDFIDNGAILSIHYDRADENHGVDEPVNVEYSDSSIRFGWMVDSYATGVVGKLKFEIHATGTVTDDANTETKSYVWKTRTNDALNVFKSICPNNEFGVSEKDPTELDQLIEKVVTQAAENVVNVSVATEVQAAKDAAAEAKEYAEEAEATAASIHDELDGYATTENLQTEIANANAYTDEQISAVSGDVTKNTQAIDALNANITNNYYNKLEIEGIYATKQDVADAIAGMDIESKLGNYYTIEQTDQKISDAIAGVDVTDQIASKADITYVDNKIDVLDGKISTNTSNINAVSGVVAELKESIANVDTSPNLTYDIAYNDTSNPEVGQDALVLFEIQNENQENEVRTAKAKVIITGGSGGSSSSNTMTIERDGSSHLVVTADDDIVIKYKFTLVDSGGEDVGQAKATWKLGNKVIKTETVYTGDNSVDLTEFIGMGSDQKVTLIMTDDIGTMQQKIWYVSVVDVKLKSDFEDTRAYLANQPVTVSFIPYGAVDKTIHFIMDGVEVGTKVSSKAAAGLSDSYIIPAQEHGTHLFEIYMTAEINGNTITSNRIVKDIIWYDESSNVPVIATQQQTFTARQYEATNIIYTVYDPSTETPTISLKSTYVNEDGETVEEYDKVLTLTSNTQTWQYKTDVVGKHTLTIACGETVKTLIANIEEIGISVSPVTAGLAFDFNPVGRSNDDANRLWSDGSVAMTVSDNFDWVNGGYQIDENGDQYFCVKSGTTAEIGYELFGDDAKSNGKEFKLVFKTKNVANSETPFLSCLSNTNGSNHIGIEMKPQEARIYGMVGNLLLPYAEEEITEFEFNIAASNEEVPIVTGYEDGVSTRHMVYNGNTHEFQQFQGYRKPITIGSADCDVHIYRLKAYNKSLSSYDILNNFIADARSAEEMIDRYDRNQIYKEGVLDPDYLAEVCPDLRIIKIEAPYFTNNKSEKVSNTTIEYIYKNGDSVLDNWTAYNCKHSGQGTSSNNYGAAGRNLDLIMNDSGIEGVSPYIILGDGVTQTDKISLTRDSVEVDYLNVKVNIASSNNMTNALLAKRYNDYNPYKRPFVREDATEIPKIKDTMEFFNCVVFIKESNQDISTHREFADTEWHFYAIGNVGDSKKTDKTRLTDKSDKYECCLEILDVEYPLSDFPATAEAIEILENEPFDGSDTYEWRYINKGSTDEEKAEIFEYCRQRWIEFYKFVVNSTDEEFKANLGNYFVLDSALYYYLFTTRYCMVDNRAKNTFWHYGKSNDKDADGNPIRKWDLSWDYDNDTSLGLNNFGAMVYRYGLEDTDVDENGEEIFREMDSTFFCRVRDLFSEELKEMFQTLESQGAWSAEPFINEANAWQSQFPEELWRLDIQRKYIRTYNSSFINGAGNSDFLTIMANGKMKGHRAQWERNQEKYMASKYQTSLAEGDSVVLRCTKPTGDLVVQPNYTLKLTPYAYMYLNVRYGNTNNIISVRAVPNVEVELPVTISGADIVNIYSASNLRSLGDLSALYPQTVDASRATRLRELIIGNSTEGYDNPSLVTVTLGSNYLLEKLNLENLSGFGTAEQTALDLSALNNLKELYAYGTSVQGITFANAGLVEYVEIPDVMVLSMKNLGYLEDDSFNIVGLDNLINLVAENSLLDLLSIIDNAPNLQRVRLTGIDWEFEDTTVLERLYNLYGIKADGSNQDQSVLAGKVKINTIKQQELYNYQAAWPDLEIECVNPPIAQHAVTFLNYDDSVLDVQYVVNGEYAFDPVGVTISEPTRESTVSTDYTYSGWDVNLETKQIFAPLTVRATYTESTREYTVRYLTKTPTGTTAIQTTVAPYGSYVDYAGEDVVYTSEEGYPSYNYYLFSGWDKSGFVDGDKDITAQFEFFHYAGDNSVFGEGNEKFNLSSLSPVKIYALGKLIDDGVITMANTGIDEYDTYSFTMGYDVDYSDIASHTVFPNDDHDGKFDGTQSTCYKSGIKALEEDRDFVIAIDYKMDSDTATDGVLAQCYQASTFNGFRIAKNSNDKVELSWGSTKLELSDLDCREVIVLRHVKGENTVTVYNSNLSGAFESGSKSDDIAINTLSNSKYSAINNELVFGCAMPNSTTYQNYAIGNINWCKIWYCDLGEDTCKKLAGWPHEELSFEVCGFNNYFLSDDRTGDDDPDNDDPLCNIVLLGTHLLDRDMRYNQTNTNVGGWAASYLNSFLNTRMYDAVPSQIKAIIKKVNVYSTEGNMSDSLTDKEASGCYIFIPAAVEMGYTDSEYTNEGTKFSTIVADTANSLTESDVRKRRYADGEYAEYYLRTPYLKSTSYVFRVSASGQIQPVTPAYDLHAVTIMIAL